VIRSTAFVTVLALTAACAGSGSSAAGGAPAPSVTTSATPPSPDPRIGLRAGLTDAGEAAWNLRLISQSPPSTPFQGVTNSDLAFTGHYAIQGSYNGWQVWDISDPRRPQLSTAYVCPASQSDVSVYHNLMFVSGEDLSARLDCGIEGVRDTVSTERLRGLRIFDISDIAHPRNVGNVQTCRGSHTHTVLVDPRDTTNVYVYISGTSRVRSANELPGCRDALPAEDPNSALFRIEVIKVPVAHPDQAAIVSSPRIFNDLMAPARHGETKQDLVAAKQAADSARAAGGFTAVIDSQDVILSDQFITPLLDSVVQARGESGVPTGADSAALRAAVQGIIDARVNKPLLDASGRRLGPTQCHDITVYPAIGLAGGACGGYGLLLDISDPEHPKRIGAVADSNFSYWHSATFNNDGTKILFSDEWGGGGQPKCRASDRHEWGADAIFTLSDRQMHFQSYYKMPAPQTPQENCVAHNGSLIPIPGRDVMVQAWYQGGISVFDWTDAAHPKEIAFFDRGPVDSTRLASGGSWSTYWYNGVIVSSEIARGLDIFELLPSPLISQNEIDAARTVRLAYLNTQGQPKLSWPPSFALAKAYVDQLERSKGLDGGRIKAVRGELATAEKASGTARSSALEKLAGELDTDAAKSSDAAKVRTLAGAVKQLAGTTT
jgi:LVIVD repeat